jgi:hypothetical protein
LFGAALLAAAPAAAETLDFEALPLGSAGTSITEGAYRITAFNTLFVTGDTGSRAIVPPSPFDFSHPADIILGRTDGGAFNLVSLDVFAADSNGLGVPLSFEGTRQDGSKVFYTVDLPEYGSAAIPDTRTLVSLPDSFRNVVAVTWQNGAEFHQFDNIVVADTTAVPEPASWALMISGFGLAGCAFRRSLRKSPALAV